MPEEPEYKAVIFCHQANRSGGLHRGFSEDAKRRVALGALYYGPAAIHRKTDTVGNLERCLKNGLPAFVPHQIDEPEAFLAVLRERGWDGRSPVYHLPWVTENHITEHTREKLETLVEKAILKVIAGKTGKKNTFPFDLLGGKE